MAKRSNAKTEMQDPTLPNKRRAQRRFIGAAILAVLAVIVLPLALESEPRQAIGGIDVSIPKREDFGRRSGYWPDTSFRQASVSMEQDDRNGLFTRSPDEAPSLDANRFNPSGAAATTSAAESAQTAGGSGAGAPIDADKRAVAEVNADKAPAASPDKLASARGTAEAPPAMPPPMPERRLDRNKVDAASPSGYVIQIGAFSSVRGARAMVKEADALGFKAYTEKISTAKGARIRVRIGPYLSRDQANVARRKLSAKGIETALIAP